MTIEAAPPAQAVRTLLARTPFYLLYTESHYTPPARIERFRDGLLEHAPGIEFSYAIRRPNGRLVFRYEHERDAREALYELSALAGEGTA